MDYQKILNEIYEEIKPLMGQGKVADYIPALGKVNPNQFGFSIVTKEGEQYNVGDTQKAFSIQSISKLFTFTIALDHYSTDLYSKIGVEPSGNAFNSLVQLEYEKGMPRNPFINAGAIRVTDSLITKNKSKEETFEEILEFIRDVSDNDKINYDNEVYASEVEHAWTNLALANLMKGFGNFDNDSREVVYEYCKHCAIEMNTQELARSVLFLANQGTDPITKKKHITPQQTKRINAVMLTCGHYDASGEFAFHVGLPGKSGVGGGIVAVVPGKMGICVWSPALNKYGNSHLGTLALEKFVEKTGLSVF